jgi:hypothetical protein
MAGWVDVGASDIANRWRPLTAAEASIAATLVEDAQDELEDQLLDMGFTAAPAPQDARWERRYVRTVANMVRRLLINPEGYLEEQGEDGYRYRRDKVLSAGVIYVTDDELNGFRPKNRKRRGSFTITPG